MNPIAVGTLDQACYRAQFVGRVSVTLIPRGDETVDEAGLNPYEVHDDPFSRVAMPLLMAAVRCVLYLVIGFPSAHTPEFFQPRLLDPGYPASKGHQRIVFSPLKG
jgi:hypothetical protein